jgi:hypothetical protein
MADEKRDQMGSEGGGSYGANEREQTRDRERVAEGKVSEDTDDFITDAEMEVREANSSEHGRGDSSGGGSHK